MYKLNTKLNTKIINSNINNDVNFDYNIISHLDDVMKSEVLNFIDIVKSNNPNWNFSTLYSNLPTLTFKKDKFKTFIKDAKAFYDLKKNIVYYTQLPDLSHELFHVSTYKKVNNINICGFNQSKSGILYKYSIGYGLNEGLASLLDSLYFKHYSYYDMEETISRNLYKLTDEIMINLFNNMDLLGFINFMEKYESTYDTFNFIQMIDYICFFRKDLYKRVQKEIVDLYFECLLYTFRCYIYKLLHDIENNFISINEANKCLSSMIRLSPTNVLLGAEDMYDVTFLMDLQRHIPDLGNISKEDISRLKLKI